MGPSGRPAEELGGKRLGTFGGLGRFFGCFFCPSLSEKKPPKKTKMTMENHPFKKPEIRLQPVDFGVFFAILMLVFGGVNQNTEKTRAFWTFC